MLHIISLKFGYRWKSWVLENMWIEGWYIFLALYHAQGEGFENNASFLERSSFGERVGYKLILYPGNLTWSFINLFVYSRQSE